MTHASRHRPRLRRGAAAVAGMGISWLAAAAYVVVNDWFGAGDLWAMLVWSTPMVPLLYLLIGYVDRRGSIGWRRRAWLAGAGFVCAFGTLALAVLILGPWMGAFSFPVALCWLLGGVGGALTAEWPTPAV